MTSWWHYSRMKQADLRGRTSLCAGTKGRRIRELTSVVQKRFKFPENTVELYAEKVANRGLCAIAQAESLRYKLLGGLAVRRCVDLLRYGASTTPGCSSRPMLRCYPQQARTSCLTGIPCACDPVLMSSPVIAAGHCPGLFEPVSMTCHH